MAGPLKSGDPERLGPYELTGRLGEGGQGVVFQGRAPDGRPVAVKLLRTHLDDDTSARARFVRELESAERVAGFCTAQVLDADAEGDQPYIVSEYVPGPSLHSLVRENGPRTGGDLHRLAIGTATALAAIHQAGIVHRDFKPHNVLLGPDGPRVIDFGIARALDGSGTMTSHIVGTPAFMAPEQIAGDTLGPYTDVFAWGVTMLFAATAQSPFGSDTIPAIMHRVLNATPDLSSLPQPLGGLVAACLSKDPTQRPTAAQIVLNLLGQQDAQANGQPATVDSFLAQGATIATNRIEPLETSPADPRPTRGNPALTVAAVTIGALAVLLSQWWGNGTTSGWTYLGAPVAFAAAVVPAGRIADTVGRKKVFLAGLAGLAVALALTSVISIPALEKPPLEGALRLTLQVIQGLSAAAAMAPGLALLREALPGRRFGMAVGAWGAMMGVSDVVGFLAIYLFQAHDLDWAIPLCGVLLVVPALVLGAAGIGESRAARRTGADTPGVVLLSLALLGLTLGGWIGARHGWTDWWGLSALVAGGVLLAALVIVLLSMRTRPLPFRQAGTALLVVAAFGSLLVLQHALQSSVLDLHGGFGGYLYSLQFLPIPLAALPGALVTGALNARFGPFRLLSIGALISVAGTLGMAFTPNSTYPTLAVWLAVYGLGLGVVTVSGALAILGDRSGERTGLAGGLHQAAIAVGTLTMSAYLAIGGSGLEREPGTFRTPLLIAAATALTVAILVLLRRRPLTAR